MHIAVILTVHDNQEMKFINFSKQLKREKNQKHILFTNAQKMNIYQVYKIFFSCLLFTCRSKSQQSLIFVMQVQIISFEPSSLPFQKFTITDDLVVFFYSCNVMMNFHSIIFQILRLILSVEFMLLIGFVVKLLVT